MQPAGLTLARRTLRKKRKRILQRSKNGLQVYPADRRKARSGHCAEKQAGQQRRQQECALPSHIMFGGPAIRGRKFYARKTNAENLLSSMPNVARALTILSMSVNFCEH